MTVSIDLVIHVASALRTSMDIREEVLCTSRFNARAIGMKDIVTHFSAIALHKWVTGG